MSLWLIEPKGKQVQAIIRHLPYDKHDPILIAKTDFGKSIIFQARPLLIYEESKHTSLIITPLLQEEQAENLKTIVDCPLGKNRHAIGADAVYTRSKLG
jgi:hypothetical protein